MADPEDTGSKQKPQLFVAGQSGNPAGRPKGARNKLGEAFVKALCDDFEQHGAETIARVRDEDPTAYVKVCASILPKEITAEVNVRNVARLPSPQPTADEWTRQNSPISTH